MSKYLYKYVEYNWFGADENCVKYFEVNTILDIETEVLKLRGLDPKENKLMFAQDMEDKNKWNFFWEAKLPFGAGVANVRPGYIEKMDFADLKSQFKDKINIDLDFIAKNTIYQKSRGYYK